MASFAHYRLVAKRFDPELNLYTFGKRLYDPTLSRWLTTDPAGFVDSMNLYAYVLNNPFRYLDPDGEEAIIAISLTALYSAWSTGGLTAAAAVIGTAALPVTLAVATGVAVGWAAHEIYKSNPNLARNLLNVHATASNGMYTPYYTFTPEMAKKAEKEKKNTNPFDGPVDEDVMIADDKGNVIPVPKDHQVGGSKDGKWIQVKDSEGVPTSYRKESLEKLDLLSI